jgi:hypothetical protein
MPSRFVLIACLALLPTAAGCQNKRLPQAHVIEVWEVGEPIDFQRGLYYKGGWRDGYTQLVLFDQGRYLRRWTSVSAHGFSVDWNSGESEGKWKRDTDGHPMLRQKDRTYKRLDAIYPVKDLDDEPSAYQIGPPPFVNYLRRTYAVQWPKPFPDQIEMIPVEIGPAESDADADETEPTDDAPAPIGLPIRPYSPDE